MSNLYPSILDKWKLGSFIREKLLYCITENTKIGVHVQKWRSPMKDKLMHTFSFLGTEDFYTGLVIYFAIISDTRLAYLFLMLLCFGFYSTTFLKNLFRMPRPPSPPVAVLEKAYDWALPSLHAVNSITCPWYLFIYFCQHHNLDMKLFFICLVLPSLYTISICGSRIYLGVHSFIDIICGFITGALVLVCFVSMDDVIDLFVINNDHAMLISVIISILMLSIHPGSGAITKSYQETVSCIGVALGMLLARIYNSRNYSTLMEQSNFKDLSINQTIMLIIIRLVVGVGLILSTKEIIKALTMPLFRSIYNYWNLKFYSYSLFSKTNQLLSKHYKLNSENQEYLKYSNKSSSGSVQNGVANGKVENHSQNNQMASNGFHMNPTDIGNGYNHSVNHTKENTSVPTDSEEYWNIDIPCAYITYVCMGWVALNICPQAFHYLNLNSI